MDEPTEKADREVAVRAEDIVGVSFFALLFFAIAVTLSAAAKSLTPQKRSLRRGWGLALMSVAFVVFGLVSLQFVRSSTRPIVEGNLWDIRRSINNDRGTRFMITDATGHPVLIRCKYSGPGLVEGERARVRYIAYNNKLLEIEMLDGPFQTWHFQESSGENGWLAWAGIGVICGFFAYRQFKRSRRGQTSGEISA